MRDTIQGGNLPVLELVLDPGEVVHSEVGELGWMSDSIQLTTGAGGGMGGRGLVGALKRAAGGASILFNTYTAVGAPGLVALPAKLPGVILPVDLDGGREYLTHRHGFLAATPGVQLSVGLQQTFRGGMWGGEGFVLQRLGGAGRAWVELSGHVCEYELAPGQTLRVHPGHVGLFEASVAFQVQMLPGLANKLFGGDGLFVVALTGPGKVWLQTLTLPVLAGALAPYLGASTSEAATVGVIGGLLNR